jgi:hypothetical protein
MLRQLNETLKEARTGIQLRIEAVTAKEKTDSNDLTLLERLSLFHGLCGESIKFNESLAKLEEWLIANNKHPIYSLTQQISNCLTDYVTIISAYLEVEESIKNLGVHFDKGRIMQDVANLHKVRSLTEALNKVLHGDSKEHSQLLGGLSESIEDISPSSCGPLDLFGLFGAKQQDANVVKIAELLKPLVATLSQASSANEEKKSVFAFSSLGSR